MGLLCPVAPFDRDRDRSNNRKTQPGWKPYGHVCSVGCVAYREETFKVAHLIRFDLDSYYLAPKEAGRRRKRFHLDACHNVDEISAIQWELWSCPSPSGRPDRTEAWRRLFGTTNYYSCFATEKGEEMVSIGKDCGESQYYHKISTLLLQSKNRFKSYNNWTGYLRELETIVSVFLLSKQSMDENKIVRLTYIGCYYTKTKYFTQKVFVVWNVSKWLWVSYACSCNLLKKNTYLQLSSCLIEQISAVNTLTTIFVVSLTCKRNN